MVLDDRARWQRVVDRLVDNAGYVAVCGHLSHCCAQLDGDHRGNPGEDKEDSIRFVATSSAAMAAAAQTYRVLGLVSWRPYLGVTPHNRAKL